MRFLYDEGKSTQAAAYLLGKAGREMYSVLLLQLLYLADRQSLIETGYPITGARMVSMDTGPVLSQISGHITWEPAQESPWTREIEPRGPWKVGVRGEPAFDRLSRYERDLLDRIFEQWGRVNRWDVMRFVQQLPEWHDPEGCPRPVDVREILVAAGKSNEEIEEIASQVAAIDGLHALVAR